VLKPKCDGPLSNFAFKFNLRRHSLVLEELLNAVRAQRAVGRCRLTLSYSR
jgi:hypothetical protein